MRRFSILLALALATAGAVPSLLLAQHPVPSSTQVTGQLSYDGRGTFGAFTGTTDTVVGRLNGAAELAHVSGYVAGRAATLRTGNGKRDRDQWSSLEVDSFPFIRYDVDSVTVTGTRGDTLLVTLRGAFEIHGVKRAVDLPSRLILTPMVAHLMAETPMDLHDYAIGGLTKFFGALKMNPAIVVRIDITFHFSS